jgi:uncharacterized protein YciI
VAGTYWLLLYDYAEDYLERRGPLREEHLGGARAAHERGDLLMAGALAEPADGAVFIFTVDDASAIEAFVEHDPYVKAGLVTRWRIRPWTVVIGDERPN